MQLQRTVLTPAEPEKVFGYLSDFTNTTEWDPGTVRTTGSSGTAGWGRRTATCRGSWGARPS